MSGVIVGAVKDPGGANSVLPVMDFMRHTGESILLYADGVSFERLKNSRPVISAACPVEELFAYYPVRAVVTTTCSPGGRVPREIVAYARVVGKKSVAVQDFWGNHARGPWTVLPDAFCVQDEYAKKLILQSYGTMLTAEDIFVTGQPAFDWLVGVDCGAARSKLRQVLDLQEDWPLIYFSGQAWGMPHALRETINALNLLEKDLYLLFREHPRVASFDASDEFRQIRAEYLPLFYELKFGSVVNTSSFPTDELLVAGSDLIMGMYPTALVQGCYLRKPCISVWVPAAKEALTNESQGQLTEFPPSALGACLKATDAEELEFQLGSILEQDPDFLLCLRREQEKHYSGDGKAHVRVARAVYEVLTR